MTPPALAPAEGRVGPPLIVLLCLMIAGGTFSIGAFPALLPEIGVTAGLADWALGILAGVFGFARMVSNIPVGLLIARSVTRALLLAPVIVTSGVLVMTASADFPLLVLGRALMGLGHALGMVAGLTVILRVYGGGTLSSALNAFEFSAMIGILGGLTLVGLLPAHFGWRFALLVACAPLLLQAIILPALLRSLPEGQGWTAPPLRKTGASRPDRRAPATGASLVPVAFVAGAAVAIAYSTVEQFLVPVRGSREFGLDRGGIARLLAVMQVCDILALLPVGALSDRHGARLMLGLVLVSLGGGIGLVGFGTLPLAFVGAALFGLGMAGWMLPLSVLREETPPEQVAWRTALYRVGVDGGMFLGPFLSGVLTSGAAGRLLPGVMAGLLVAIGLLMLRREGRHR